MSSFKYTVEMDKFIRSNYLLPATELAQAFNKTFGTNRSGQQLHGARKARGLKTGRTGRFYKGQPRPAGSGATGATSTSFKKGHTPHNAASIGSETTTKDGYIKVKIAEPNKWEFKHRLNWETVHGQPPANLVFWFLDQDKTNCDIDNLSLIPRALQIRYNQLKLAGYDETSQETLKLIAQIRHRAGELKENA